MLHGRSGARLASYNQILMAYSPSWQSRWLDELLIRDIPSFQYSKSEGEERSLYKCVVCLNEFQENDTLKVLPSCKHGFHLDCIDIWLQSNDNCPLCRLSISGTTRYPIDRIIAPNSSPQDPQPFISRGLMGSDEDFVVIELSEEQERNESREHLVQSISHSPRKVDQKIVKMKHQESSIMHQLWGMNASTQDKKMISFVLRPFGDLSQWILQLTGMFTCQFKRLYGRIGVLVRLETMRNAAAAGSESFGNGRGSRSSVLPIEF